MYALEALEFSTCFHASSANGAAIMSSISDTDTRVSRQTWKSMTYRIVVSDTACFIVQLPCNYGRMKSFPLLH